FIFILGININIYSFTGGDGSLANPYLISNCNHLQNISLNLSANYELNNNIDCGVFPHNSGTGFKTIGSCGPISSCWGGGDDIYFNGNFNGNNYTIANLYINNISKNGTGLFAIINFTSKIKDFGLINVNISGYNYIGSLVGLNAGANISNIYSTGHISGNQSIGGLIGHNSNNIIDGVYSTIDIVGTDYLGGLIGNSDYTIIKNSHFLGTINGRFILGGLVGYMVRSTINQSYSSANIVGINNIGGLAGYMQRGIINQSYSLANIVGINNIGGLVGQIHGGNIYISYSSANINAVNYTGGLVGKTRAAYPSKIANSYTKGNINGSNIVGGLVGENLGYTYFIYIENSYSSGNVNGITSVGGLVGKNIGGTGRSVRNATINNSFSTSNVTGITDVGGLVGINYNSNSYILNSYWNNHSANPNVGIGSDVNSQLVIAISDNLSYFFFQLNNPLSIWNTSVWNFADNNLPILSWQPFQNNTNSQIGYVFPFTNNYLLLLIIVSIFFYFVFPNPIFFFKLK
ncbi:MAG: hypothetical protein KC589_10850, partial [Nanoarchaeota archaeon]|nr:hypothetical protein [Nanoarchaeota archaeon]